MRRAIDISDRPRGSRKICRTVDPILIACSLRSIELRTITQNTSRHKHTRRAIRIVTIFDVWCKRITASSESTDPHAATKNNGVEIILRIVPQTTSAGGRQMRAISLIKEQSVIIDLGL